MCEFCGPWLRSGESWVRVFVPPQLEMEKAFVR
jgi:hypothetical protein